MSFALLHNGSLTRQERADAIVPWWSFTKTVLSAAALSLVRDALIALDAPVFGEPFTLRQLLQHEAGLADYGELADYHAAVARHEEPWSEQEMMERLDGHRLRYRPGTGWGYSNVGYMHLARLIERVTGRGLDAVLRERVFAPLGLLHTRLARGPKDMEGVYLGAAKDYHPGWVYHGLLVGSLAEASLLLERLLAGKLLPQALLREMQRGRKVGGPTHGRPWTSSTYGLGVMQGGVGAGLTYCGHTGAGPGSVIAVYRNTGNNESSCCAVFHAGMDAGAAEAEVVSRLLAR